MVIFRRSDKTGAANINGTGGVRARGTASIVGCFGREKTAPVTTGAGFQEVAHMGVR